LAGLGVLLQRRTEVIRMGVCDVGGPVEPGRLGARPTGMTAPRRFSLAAVSVAVAVVALAGCGTQQGGGAPAGGGPAGGTTTTSAPAPTTVVPTKPSGPKGVAVVVTGVIEAGVESGCFVLTPDKGGEKYLIMGQSKPPTGVPVTVHGVTQPGTVSYCQQGTPLQVSTVELR
jgi:hypothetical protein